MEEAKVSELPVATSINDDDIVMIVQDGFNKQITKEDLFNDTEQNIEDVETNLQEQITNLQNQVNDKNAITIGLNADTSVTSSTAYKIVDLNLTSQLDKIGTKLSLSSGKVLIGSGVSKVLVSATAQTQGDSNMWGLSILKNSTEVSNNYCSPSGAGYEKLTASPRLLSVTSGDTIKMGIYINVANSTKTMRAYNGNGTYLTVEAID